MSFLKKPELTVQVLDLSQYICNSKICSTFVDEVNIYRDHDHLSVQGSRFIGLNSDLLKRVLELADTRGEMTNSGSEVAGEASIENYAL